MYADFQGNFYSTEATVVNKVLIDAESYTLISLCYSIGYNFNSQVFLWAGVSLMFDSEYTYLPLYADFRVDLMKSKVTPVLGLKLGTEYVGTRDYDEFFGFVDFSVSAKVRFDNRKELSLGFTTMSFNSKPDETVSAFGVKISFGF